MATDHWSGVSVGSSYRSRQVRSRGSRTRGNYHQFTPPGVRPRPTLRIAKRRAPRASGEVSARQDGAGACTACHRGQLGDDRRPLVREPRGRFKVTPQSCKLPVEAVEHRLPCRSHKNQCLPLTSLFAPPPARITPAAFGTKLGSNIAYLSRRGFLRTHACPWSGSRSPDQGLFICISASGRVSKI